MSWLTDVARWVRSRFVHDHSISLEYFEGILPVELRSINARRERLGRRSVKPLRPVADQQRDFHKELRPFERQRSPDPGILFPRGGGATSALRSSGADPYRPNLDKMRPQPVPCTASGLALSGGGIRSAAISLGAIQALAARDRLSSLDYLSTVSGGGYIGGCLSAAMSSNGGRRFPFGTDFIDSDAVAHLRNYSNYLMPRGRSAARNAAEATVIILRGLVANAVIVITAVLFLALVTYAFALRMDALGRAGPRAGFLLSILLSRMTMTRSGAFVPAIGLALLLASVLLVWAVWRSLPRARSAPSDTRGPALRLARNLLFLILIAVFIALQPSLIAFVQDIHVHGFGRSSVGEWLSGLWAVLAGLTAALSTFSGSIGRFLEESKRTANLSTTALRLLTRASLLIVACVLPLTIWLIYLILAAALIHSWPVPDWADASRIINIRSIPAPPLLPAAILMFVAGLVISLLLGANGYSLHRFYRDRLSKAFLFRPPFDPEPMPLDFLRLSELQDADGPYHIINAALNVQASVEANRRGRNADFFIFTPDFVGSDLTMYTSTERRSAPGLAPTTGMEAIDVRLDLATAVAISGAAISANMGSSTIRVLSPTLALLNVRLGYWLANPRALARRRSVTRPHIGGLLRNFREKFYLLTEMLNLQDETSRLIFLSDGGHIENLGIYELLKRGCQTIIAIDAEADPHMAFPSLLKLERYARIDLGVRISLPWEPIAAMHRLVREGLEGDEHLSARGPHCAVGRIYYADGSAGVLVYFKASLTGDEKDYILDYARRHPAFPHETTGDQFFGEEQFEMYRALGYHMVDGFFGRSDRFAFCSEGALPFNNADSAFQEVDAAIPADAQQ